MKRIRVCENYNHTIYASYIGYIAQAIINNFVPLLFLTFQNIYEISLDKIGILITINFGVQLFTDILAAKFVDKIGYRISVVAAHIFCVIGLIGFVIFPSLFSNGYIGIILGVICYAIGDGMIEVLISPIVEACPTNGLRLSLNQGSEPPKRWEIWLDHAYLQFSWDVPEYSMQNLAKK
ncbi:hypothetical protein EDD66_10928 [Mobilisporobacter senegalensis]|uniref:MFS transporter n=1 Tax=Mobilisporobacter senegalensis TaxID=1329262 RepID=A0A3N1XGH1_9FIRM|nr:hypothetical protein EDD66_10928 [Mobilisporobacter senegalensis]